MKFKIDNGSDLFVENTETRMSKTNGQVRSRNVEMTTKTADTADARQKRKK